MSTAMNNLIKKLPKDFVQDNLVEIAMALHEEGKQMLSEWQRGFDDAKYIYEPKNVPPCSGHAFETE